MMKEISSLPLLPPQPNPKNNNKIKKYHMYEGNKRQTLNQIVRLGGTLNYAFPRHSIATHMTTERIASL